MLRIKKNQLILKEVNFEFKNFSFYIFKLKSQYFQIFFLIFHINLEGKLQIDF